MTATDAIAAAATQRDELKALGSDRIQRKLENCHQTGAR